MSDGHRARPGSTTTTTALGPTAALAASASASSISSKAEGTNFDDDYNEWELGIGDLIIDLDADIEKSNRPSLPMASPPMASPVEHQATVDKGLKMKIKRKNMAKHEIVKARDHSPPPPVAVPPPPTKHSSSKGSRSSSHKKKLKLENGAPLLPLGGGAGPLASPPDLDGPPNGVSAPSPSATDGDLLTDEGEPSRRGKGSETKGSAETRGSDAKGLDAKVFEGTGSDAKVSEGKGSAAKVLDGKGLEAKACEGKGLETKGSDAGCAEAKGSDVKDGKLERLVCGPASTCGVIGTLQPPHRGSQQHGAPGGAPGPPLPGIVERKDSGVLCTSVGTITEPDCLGPCEPGTSVTLEGIVWQETHGGVLVVNVTWRGKTYVGTLLDCTRHDWAPPRLCDSPTSDVDCSKGGAPKGGRGKRRGPAVDALDSRTPSHGKLRNGKGRRFPAPCSPAPCSPAKAGDKRRSRPSDLELSPNAKRSRSRSTPTPEASQPPSPALIECPEPNCSKKYKHINGLRYHQTHAHGESSTLAAGASPVDATSDVEEESSDVRGEPPSPPGVTVSIPTASVFSLNPSAVAAPVAPAPTAPVTPSVAPASLPLVTPAIPSTPVIAAAPLAATTPATLAVAPATAVAAAAPPLAAALPLVTEVGDKLKVKQEKDDKYKMTIVGVPTIRPVSSTSTTPTVPPLKVLQPVAPLSQPEPPLLPSIDCTASTPAIGPAASPTAPPVGALAPTGVPARAPSGPPVLEGVKKAKHKKSKNKEKKEEKKENKAIAGLVEEGPPEGREEAGVPAEAVDTLENVQSPAYSDISDANDSAPVLESEAKEKEEDGERGGGDLHPYYPYYGQPPYLLPGVAQQGEKEVSPAVVKKEAEPWRPAEATGPKEVEKKEEYGTGVQQYPYPLCGYGYPYGVDPTYPVHMVEPQFKPYADDKPYRSSPPPPAKDRGEKGTNRGRDKSPPCRASPLKEKQSENHQILKENIELKNHMEKKYAPYENPPYDQRRFMVMQQQQTTAGAEPDPKEELRGVGRSLEVGAAKGAPLRGGSPKRHPPKETRSEGQKPTMETTGPPPGGYAYLHPGYLTAPSHFPPPVAFEPVYRGLPHYGGSPYLRFHVPEVGPPRGGPPPPSAAQGGPKALDLLHQVSQHYGSGSGGPTSSPSSHKIHELQERAAASPTGGPKGPSGEKTPTEGRGRDIQPQGGLPPTSGAVGAQQGAVQRGEEGSSRSPPPLRHLHTHHHTHVGVGYPLYDPYGVPQIPWKQSPPQRPYRVMQ